MKKCNVKVKYRMLTILMVFVFLLGLSSPSTAAAAEEADDGYTQDEAWLYDEGCGYENFECIWVSDEEAEALADSFEVQAETAYSATRDFDVYSNDYCRSRMNSEEQAFYDRLDALCGKYISQNVDAVKWEKFSAYYIEGVSYSGITSERAKELTYLFLYQNPQYYFLHTGLLYSSQYIWIKCYDNFADGDERAEVTEQFYSKIDAWMAEIDAEDNLYGKEKRVHDIVCDNVSYVGGEFDQSAYSAVILGESVCAGYTKMFGILANGAGIETVGITGSNHAWNRVKLYGRWYNVDTTWDDQGYMTIYRFFNKSDAAILDGHVQHDIYNGLAPVCGVDYDESTAAQETIVNVTGITLDRTVLDFDIDVNTETTLTATIAPANATDDTVFWISSDTDVAVVSANGQVSAVAPGSATITALTTDGAKRASCSIKVCKKLSTPPAPVIVSKDTSGVILLAMDGCEYSRDGKNWQTSEKFTGLRANKEYTFYARRKGYDYYMTSDKSTGTTVRLDRLDATVASDGIFLLEHTKDGVIAGLTTSVHGTANVEYRWLVYDISREVWQEVAGWSGNGEWLNWNPPKTGNYIILGQARVIGNEDSVAEASIGIEHHKYIKGKCQMPYDGQGGGYLIGMETYENPNQEYRYEMLILDCTLLAEGKPAWTYTTGKCRVNEGNAFWTIWQPEYGYYWTLFRVYDSSGVLIDEECYPFVNAY